MEELSCVFLEREDYPEWFTLDFLPVIESVVGPRLLIGIKSILLYRLPDAFQKYRLLDGYKKRLKEHGVETEFLMDFNNPWGFGGVLEPYVRPGHTETGISTYTISIPQIEKDIGECEECHGTGETEETFRCINCGARGRKRVMEWNVVDCIGATLCALGDIFLDKPFKELLVGIHTKKKQLLSIQTSFEKNRGEYIGATLATPFCTYLRLASHRKLPRVKEAIRSTYLHMFPSYEQFGDYGFRAEVHNNGQLILAVPGDACDMSVDGFDPCLEKNSGPMKLGCHNVDGIPQQLSLLSGLAALSGMVRKELYPEQM